MTLRDDLINYFMSKRSHWKFISDDFLPNICKEDADAILAVIQPRFNKIIQVVRRIDYNLSAVSLAQGRFDNDYIARELENIDALCTLDTPEPADELGTLRRNIMSELEPLGKEGLEKFFEGLVAKSVPATPTLQVGQLWEKSPEHRCRILYFHTNKDGVEYIMVENDNGYPVVMKPETFEGYRLVEGGDV